MCDTHRKKSGLVCFIRSLQQSLVSHILNFRMKGKINILSNIVTWENFLEMLFALKAINHHRHYHCLTSVFLYWHGSDHLTETGQISEACCVGGLLRVTGISTFTQHLHECILCDSNICKGQACM